MNKKIVTIVAVALTIIFAISLVRNAKKKDASAKVARLYPTVVSTVILQSKEQTLTLPSIAVVQNDKDVVLASKIPARVRYIKSSGSTVQKGEVVVRLDNTSIVSGLKSVNTQVTAVETALTNLQQTHERTQELIDVKGASIEQSQMEESKIAELTAKKESLVGKVTELKNMLSYATITAPVSGKISKTMVHTGNMAMPGHPIAMIQAKNNFSLLLRVPSTIKVVGVKFRGNEYKSIPLNSTFNGLVEYKVYVSDNELISGDRVEVDAEIFKGNATLLPFDAVLNRNGKSFVLLVDGDHAIPQAVDLIKTAQEGCIVNDKSIENRQIVLAKQDVLLKLLTGSTIKIKKD